MAIPLINTQTINNTKLTVEFQCTDKDRGDATSVKKLIMDR